MKTIEIFWDDLTAEKQAEISKIIGNKQNFDVMPLAVVEIEEPEPEIDPCDNCTKLLCYGCEYSENI